MDQQSGIKSPSNGESSFRIEVYALKETTDRHPYLVKASVAILSVGLLAAGCAPTSVNLTPSHPPAASTGLYPFEVQWDSPRRGIKADDLKAYVVIGTNLFPMTRVANTPNRWEALVPLPPHQTSVPYRYKFDYRYPEIRNSSVASDLSDEYHLVVPRN